MQKLCLRRMIEGRGRQQRPLIAKSFFDTALVSGRSKWTVLRRKTIFDTALHEKKAMGRLLDPEY